MATDVALKDFPSPGISSMVICVYFQLAGRVRLTSWRLKLLGKQELDRTRQVSGKAKPRSAAVSHTRDGNARDNQMRKAGKASRQQDRT